MYRLANRFGEIPKQCELQRLSNLVYGTVSTGGESVGMIAASQGNPRTESEGTAFEAAKLPSTVVAVAAALVGSLSFTPFAAIFATFGLLKASLVVKILLFCGKIELISAFYTGDGFIWHG